MRALAVLLLILLACPPARASDPAPGYDLVVLGEVVADTYRPIPPRDPASDRLPPGLADALALARTLSPDMVVTTGNQFAAPDSPAQWRDEQARFTDAMDALGVPWIGVKGATERSLAAPDSHNAILDAISPGVETRDLGFALVVMVDTDAAPEPAVSRDQIEQIGDALAHSGARQVLVFMHDALWLGAGWDDLRGVLVADGRPATVFASSARVWRDDALDANIHRYTLGPVFGDDGRPFSDAYAWPHLTVVRVRPSGVTPIIVPLHDRKGRAGVLPGDWQTGADVDLARALADGDWLEVSGDVPATPDAECRGPFHVRVTNPTDTDLAYRVAIDHARGATVSPREIAGTLAAHESAETEFDLRVDQPGAERPSDAVRAAIDYTMPNGQTQKVIGRAPVPARLMLPADAGVAATDPAQNGVLSLDGRSALEADLPACETFTLECWVHTDSARDGAVIASTLSDGAGFGLYWMRTADGEPRPVGIVCAGGQTLTLPVVGVWDWDRWAHLALTFDGHAARLFVNGRLHQEIPATGALDASRTPLVIGAAPTPGERTGTWFKGQLDEVRLSSAPIYSAGFEPARVLEAGASTVLLLHFDDAASAPGADASGHANHAWSIGSPEVVTDPRR